MLPCVWFSNRSQKTSICVKNISDTLCYASCATFLFLPHFDVICDLLLNRRTATWNLFVLYNNEKPFYFKIFQQNAKAGLLPRLCKKKKPVDVIYDWFKMKQFHWLLCVAKNRDWSRKIVPLSNLTQASFLDEWKLTAKAELNCEIYKSWRKCWKNQVSFFIGAALWAEKLGRCPENYRSWKNTVGKLVVTVNLEAIWFEFWMRGV